MNLQISLYVILLLVGATILVLSAFHVLRRRMHVAASRTGAILLLAGSVWMIAFALEFASQDLPGVILASKAQFPGIVSVPVLWFVYVFQYTGHDRWLTRRVLLLMSVVPVAALVLAWTNESHHLIWARIELNTDSPFRMARDTWGVGFYVLVAYIYTVVLIANGQVLRTLFRSRRIYRWQMIALLAAVLLPLAASTLDVFHWSPVPDIDMTALALVVTGPITAFSLYRLRLGDIVPVAREQVVESMGDVVMVVDAQHRLLDLNRAAEELLGAAASRALGYYLAQLSSDLSAFLETSLENTGESQQVKFYNAKSGTRQTYDIRCTPMRDWRNSLIGTVIVLRDVTDRVKTEETLLRLSNAVQTSTDGILVTDLEGTIVDVNPAAMRLYGTDDINNLIGTSSFELLAPEDRLKARETTPLILKNGYIERQSYHAYTKIGDRIPVEVSIAVVKDLSDKPSGFVSITRDITDRVLMEMALDRDRKAFRIIAEVATQATDVSDLCYRILSGLINVLSFDSGTVRLYEEITGVLSLAAVVGQGLEDREDELPPQHISDPDYLAAHVARTRSAIFVQDTEVHDLPPRLLDRLRQFGVRAFISWPIIGSQDNLLGTVHLLSSAPRMMQGADENFFRTVAGMFATVLERKQAEDLIKASLREKEVLLKEIHHRVKNNLQIISSLLSLQAGQAQGEVAATYLSDSQRRVRAMALIHEKLYQSNDISRIDFGEYLSSLVNGLIGSHGSLPVQIQVDVSDIQLGLNSAIPCGLIVNELVSNALKHAFPDGNGGNISVGLDQDGERLRLTVADDGIGISDGVDIRSSETLGLQLVQSLVEQIDGELTLNHRGGASFEIAFVDHAQR